MKIQVEEEEYLLSQKMRSPLNVSLPSNVVEFVTTANELPQYKVVRSLGIVRGISVRSRNIFASITAVCCSLCGGSNSMFIQLCEDTREEAYDVMRKRAGTIITIIFIIIIIIIIIIKY